jgi:hypothetical protein
MSTCLCGGRWFGLEVFNLIVVVPCKICCAGRSDVIFALVVVRI